METFIKDLRRILDEYEARQKEKTEVLTTGSTDTLKFPGNVCPSSKLQPPNAQWGNSVTATPAISLADCNSSNEALTGTVKVTNLGSLVGDSRPSEKLVFHTNGECVINISDGLKSFQQSLQDVNAAGRFSEDPDSFYNSISDLKIRLESIVKRFNIKDGLDITVSKGNVIVNYDVDCLCADSSGVEELSPYIEHILNTNEELKKRLEEKNREIDELRTSHEDPRVISEITKLKIRLGEEEDKRKKVEADLENAVRKIEMKDQKIKELARDYNQMLDLKDRWEAMVICRPHPDDQLRRQIKIYEDLIADKNKRIEELEGNLDLSIISASSPNKLVEEYEQLVRRQNKLISDLRDQIKGECKVDRFEASIEKLNEIVGILDQWRNNDCRNRQKAVKSESGGETGQVIA